MKIVFETEEEKRQFMVAGCPNDIPLVIPCNCETDYDYEEGVCEECWKNSGVILEVDDDPGDPDFDYEN